MASVQSTQLPSRMAWLLIGREPLASINLGNLPDLGVVDINDFPTT